MICFLLATVSYAASDPPSSEPEAHLPESLYEFPPAVEGRRVTHTFTIENRGDAPLEIIDIKSG
jgi:hypothetical protein